MERFRLRVRYEPRRGNVWELKLFPEHPHRTFLEADGKVLGSVSAPEAILWLRQVAEPFLRRAETSEPMTAEIIRPDAGPWWLSQEDGMRLALAFTAARWLKPKQRQEFRERLEELPSEVVLYWFTLCFYGYRRAAGRAALRTLLTHLEPTRQYDKEHEPQLRRSRKPPRQHGGKSLFDLSNGESPSATGSSAGARVRNGTHQAAMPKNIWQWTPANV